MIVWSSYVSLLIPEKDRSRGRPENTPGSETLTCAKKVLPLLQTPDTDWHKQFSASVLYYTI